MSDPTPEEHRELERKVVEAICEAVVTDIDTAMLTPCVICGEIGWGHMGDEPPEGCTGFVMPEDADA